MNAENDMKTKASRSVGRLLLMAAVAASGCDDRRHLVGDTGTGGGAPPPVVTGATGGAPGTMAPRPLRPASVDAVTRMAWLLWQSAPDDALLASADMLTTSEDVRQLGLRMQQDARAQLGVKAFYRWWLQLDGLAEVQKDPTLFPTFNAALASDMVAETETFATSITLDLNGTFAQLLTAPFSYLNESLAAVYAVSGVSGTALHLTPLPPDRRAGLFTQPSFLALHAHEALGSPVLRGLFITSRVFCLAPPPPPVSIDMRLPPRSNATLRERVEAATADPLCRVCHNLLEGVGFAFEHYDAIGQYRTLDNGLPIDASAHLYRATPPAPQDVNGSVELAAALAHDPGAQACMTHNWMEYALGRRPAAADEPSVTEAHRWFTMSDFNLQSLIAAVMQTDAFLSSPPICTPGADQTCNDDPTISSLHGHCTLASRCVCATGSPNPDTGRCP